MLHFTLSFSLNSNFLCSWVYGYADWSSSLCNDEAVMLNFFLASEAANLNPPSNISFTSNIPSSVNETSNIFITKYSSGYPCSPNPPNFLPPLRSPERPPHPYTTSQIQSCPNYHFNLVLLSADDPTAPHYENHLQVFKSSQKTLTMEVHHHSHYLFDQIISLRLWKNLNQ